MIGSPFWNRMPVTGSQSHGLLSHLLLSSARLNLFFPLFGLAWLIRKKIDRQQEKDEEDYERN